VSALPIEVTPTEPPSQAVMALGQRVDLGACGARTSVAFTVGIWPDGHIEALRGYESYSRPAPAPVPEGFSALAYVRLAPSQGAVRACDIERIDL
jgi:hypothetical protein